MGNGGQNSLLKNNKLWINSELFYILFNSSQLSSSDTIIDIDPQNYNNYYCLRNKTQVIFSINNFK